MNQLAVCDNKLLNLNEISDYKTKSFIIKLSSGLTVNVQDSKVFKTEYNLNYITNNFSQTLEYCGKPINVDEMFSFFVGVLTESLFVLDKETVVLLFSNTQNVMIHAMKEYLKVTFNVESLTTNSYEVVVKDFVFRDWLIHNKIVNEDLFTNEVPHVIRASNKNNILSYINAVYKYNSDGMYIKNVEELLQSVEGDFVIHNLNNHVKAQQLLVLFRYVGLDGKIVNTQSTTTYTLKTITNPSKEDEIISVVESNDEPYFSKPGTHIVNSYTIHNKRPIPFNTVGLFTYLRTYARRHNDADVDSTVESLEECISRVVKACDTQLNVGFTKDEESELFELLYNLKCSVAGRMLWQLGTKTVDKLGLMSLQNCSFVIINEPVRPFVWTMSFLMLGSGVGIRVLPSDLENLPLIKHVKITRNDVKDADFIVPDSREGWCKLLGKLLKAHFYSGEDLTYSCTLLRSEGAPIRGFGGVSSGPEVLCDGIHKMNDILNKKANSKLTSIDALDICNLIGYIVVSGNVRRCLPWYNLVHTQNGLVPIRDVQPGTLVLTSDGYKKVKFNFYQGRQKLINIITENGHFACTPNHKMAIWCENKRIDWEEAGKLKYGNKLILPDEVIPGVDTFFPNKKIPFNLLASSALACLHKNIFTINKFLSSHQIDTVNEFLRLFEDNAEITIGEITGEITYHASEELKNYIIEHILCTRLQDYILQAKSEYRSNYLSILFNYSTACIKHVYLAQDLQNLLYSCGIISELKSNQVHHNFVYTEINILPEHIHTDTVIRIENIGVTEETYDLEIEDNHEFFCNGHLVHNSAEIVLGDAKDNSYLKAKRWDLGNIPSYRAYSNNSVICNDISEVLNNEEFWKGYTGVGEPYGLVNLNLMRKTGRIGDEMYSDKDVEGCNPCAEQSLCNYETCCLAEIFLPNINTREELMLCIKYLYRICKHSLMLKCPQSKETDKIVHENMRMGIGVTGYLQATELQKSWLSGCYEELRQYDKEYSNSHGFPVSIKLTTCKPSGTLSLLGNVTPGVHPAFARYYIRRIRISSESPLIKLANTHGYETEYVKNFDGSLDLSTTIISFPHKVPDSTVLAEECTAINQLEYVKRLQTEWSDNAVSVTVYYRKEELPEIKEWLRTNYNSHVKSVSFLLRSDHGFLQAPMEEICLSKYLQMIKSCKPIDDVEGICYFNDEKHISETECVGGVCPIR